MGDRQVFFLIIYNKPLFLSFIKGKGEYFLLKKSLNVNYLTIVVSLLLIYH